jgi:hypothetical protein
LGCHEWKFNYEQADVGLDLSLIIDMIGEEAFRHACIERKHMSKEQAIACALASNNQQ